MELKAMGLNKQITQGSGLNGQINSKSKNHFGLFLNRALEQVNDLQVRNEEYKKLLVTGEVDNLHDITIATEKANVSLQLVLGIRNKVIEAYREIMRMQI